MATEVPRLHLASGSPRRAEILESLRLEFTAAGVDIDESRGLDESPQAMVRRLSHEKALAADMSAERVVIGADTAVVLGDAVFGKPESEEHAVEMLLALSGRSHEVLTGVTVVGGGRVCIANSRSEVHFRDIDPAEAADYWHSGEPRDKAGAYAIQGLGGVFVKVVRGSYSGVVGLPVYETASMLTSAGIDILKGTEPQ